MDFDNFLYFIFGGCFYITLDYIKILFAKKCNYDCSKCKVNYDCMGGYCYFKKKKTFVNEEKL